MAQHEIFPGAAPQRYEDVQTPGLKNRCGVDHHTSSTSKHCAVVRSITGITVAETFGLGVPLHLPETVMVDLTPEALAEPHEARRRL